MVRVRLRAIPSTAIPTMHCNALAGSGIVENTIPVGSLKPRMLAAGG
jgi:hypothetical protein